MALTKAHNRMIEGSFVNVLDFGADPTGSTDSATAIQAAIDENNGTVYLPTGEYLCNSPIYLRHGTKLVGAGKYRHPSNENGSEIIGAHTGAGVIVSELTLNANVSDLVIRGDQTTTPKTGIAHGRSTSSSSGNSTYQRLSISGYYSEAGIYFIASEGNVVERCDVTIQGGGALYCFYTNQADALSVNSYTSSSNITGVVKDCFFQFPNNTSGGICIYMDAGDLTTEWMFENNYGAVPDNGYFAFFNSVTSASATRGPITFINNGAEKVSGAAPSGLFRFETTSVKSFFGFTFINNRLTDTTNAISTNDKVVLNNLYYSAPNTSAIVDMTEDIQCFGLNESWVKTNGTVTVDDAARNTKNTIIEDGITSFVSPGGSATAQFQANNTKYLEVTSDASNLYPEIETSIGKFFLRTTANSGSGAVIEAIPAGDQAFRPEVNDTYKLGRAAFLWSEVFAGTGTINTSDERKKQDIRDLSDAEVAVAVRLKGLIKAYHFKNAVEKKGDEARIHVGVIAQQVIAAFEAEGLDPMRYGVVCYDEWEEEVDADGNVIVEAGNAYGVRYDELWAFIISTL